MLLKILKVSEAQIMVFLFLIMIAVSFLGVFMYFVEEAGFTSIPWSGYEAIVTP
jgi:uncharacterized protein (UPF0333 family)